MLKIVKFLFILMFLLVIGAATALYFAIESTPLVVSNSSQQVSEADSVKKLMEQISTSLKNRSKRQTIELSAEQLNSLVGFAQRAHRPFNGAVDISPEGTVLKASYKLPQNPLGETYLNLDINILPADGIALRHVKVGQLAIPGGWAVSISTFLIDWYTNSDIGTQFLQQVEAVSMDDTTMFIKIRPLKDFINELNLVKEGMKRSGNEALIERTTTYLTILNNLDIGQQSRSQSLAQFIGPVFAQARLRSTYETAVDENEAAILALAIYAGDHHFANFVGDVQPIKGKIAKPKAPPVLAEREDLNKHFIFSAAIKVLSEQGISTAIGEFKELMDRGNGGSGYSFIDLTADYAGVKFAQTATEPKNALRLQDQLADSNLESVIFPSINDLPEGLSKKEFKQQFISVDSPQYIELIDEVHKRVDALPIHQ